MNVTREEIKQFLKDSIEWLVDQDQGCSTLALDNRLAICVGWLDGYDENDEDVIHSKEEPKYAINAGIKVYTSDDMRTDYEFINSPYYDNGEVVQSDVSVQPNVDLDELADYFIKEYANLENLEIEEDGRIIEDNFDDAYEPMEDEEEVEQEVEVKEESLKEEKEEIHDKQDVFNALNHYIEVLEGDRKRTPEGESNDILRNVIGALKEIVSDLSESCKKQVKESWEGESIIDDLVERATSMIDEGEDVDDAVRQAIDDGLIYTDDIYELARHYGSLDDSDIIESYYDDLYNDVYSQVEDYIPDREEEEEDEFEDEEETDESLKESDAKDKYLDLERMTIEDIRTAPIGWYWEGDGETVIKIDEDKIFLVANYIGDTVENYVKGMIEEFGSNAKLKDLCDDDCDENNLGIMSEDELEEYRDEWEDAYIDD